jgi:hypothetical protein
MCPALGRPRGPANPHLLGDFGAPAPWPSALIVGLDRTAFLNASDFRCGDALKLSDDRGEVGDATRQPIDANDASASPFRMKSSSVRSSARPCVDDPLRFSLRMTVQPAAFSAASWMSIA